MFVFWWQGRGFLTLLILVVTAILVGMIADAAHVPSCTRLFWAAVLVVAAPGRNAWPALAAHADALVEREIIADAGHLGQHARAVADQRRALDRRAELAVLDQIGLGAGEDELARDDIDLPAAEALGEDAV